MKKRIPLILVLAAAAAICAQQNVRIKDVAHIAGIEELQLFGYGLVVGLDQTGDRYQTIFTEQSVINMLLDLGVERENIMLDDFGG